MNVDDIIEYLKYVDPDTLEKMIRHRNREMQSVRDVFALVNHDHNIISSEVLVAYATICGFLADLDDMDEAKAIVLEALFDGEKPDPQKLFTVTDVEEVIAALPRGFLRRYPVIREAVAPHVITTFLVARDVLKSYLEPWFK